MVFLRLSIKVFPREQLSSSSSSSWGRTFLGARKTTNDDCSQGSAVSTTLKKPGIFLLVLEHPEEVSLGGLAGMIQEHWGKLHPELEPLAIKKILDDTKEDLDLYPDLSVADVWVDYGKARTDGLDQRGSVRVIQKPTTAAPERFPSVDQDWDAAIVAYERKRAMKDKKEAMEAQFPAIQEEDEEGNAESLRTHSRSPSRSHIQWEHSPESPQHTNNDSNVSARKSPVEHRHRDLPLSSVEIPNPVTTSPPAKSIGPTIAGTPPPRRESEELGESPSPAERRASSTRSQPTPASVAAGSLEPHHKSTKLAKRPIASSTAKRTITQMPDDAESPPISSAPNPHQPMQSTEEATASSSDMEPESAPQRTVKLPLKPGVTNGVNGQGHLAAVAKSVSKPPQKEQVETVVGISSDASSEEQSDSEDDKVEAGKKKKKKKKNAEQDERETEDQTGSDNSDDSESDSESESESESESDSDASEENEPKDDAIKPRIDHLVPSAEDVIDLEGDVQMEEPVVSRRSHSSDQSDLPMPKINGTTHETRSRKRKQAPEEPTSVKEARQGQGHPSTRPSTPPRSVPAVVVPSQQARQSMSKSPAAQTSPLHKRVRAPSFSSPARQASVREENEAPPKPHPFGIGLGITQSPPSKQPVSLDLSQESDVTSTQNSFAGSLFPSSNVPVTSAPSFTSVNKHTPVIDRTKKLQSAIRGKDSPATERRSVSFAEGEDLASGLDTAPRSTPRNATISKSAPSTNTTQGTPSSATTRKATPKAKSAQEKPTAVKSTLGTPSTSTSSKVTPKTKVNNQTPKSAFEHTQATPSSSQVVYPPGFDIDQLTQEVEIEKKAKAQAKADEKVQREKELAERTEIERKLRETFEPRLVVVLTEMQTLLRRLANTKLELVRRKPLRVRLEGLRQDLKAYEEKLEAAKSTPREPVAKKSSITLKDMLSSQKQEMAAKLRPEPKSAPAPRSDVYEVPSSSESESESESESDSSSDDDSKSDSESGDIMPDGQSVKLRKPYPQRSN
ncbi:unnamed protein product [Penicillium egyptiacum]|uniref:Nucleolar protein Dnt1-like N-terminal domain-containing protein n=1 Tax=Penicillium egyptiacum TaxID=1303716 RepID=A0A9W4K9D5_9EURO|nr:unnamed protein product [Penicillium egyptiacum]